jgi:replicative DNA helicase
MVIRDSPGGHDSGITMQIPPHSLEAEMSMLGSMLLDRDAITNILPIIGREESHWFYRPDHELLFGGIIDLYDANHEIDLVTVSDAFQKKEILDQVGGVPYLVELAESVPTTANAEHYARIVRDKGMLRDLIRCVDEISRDAYQDRIDTKELLDRAEQQFFQVTERRISRQAVHIREMLGELYAKVESGDQSYTSGLPTGFTELDDLTSGFQPGDMIIVAGRPSMGKTALGLTIATHMAVDDQIPCVFFSMEMSNEQVAQRILCSRGEVNSHRFRKRQISEEQIKWLGNVCAQLESAPLFVDDTPGMSIMELRAKIRRLVRQHDVRAVFVDYLQLMHSPGSESRQQEISTISRGLKSVGRELNIPIIAMAQLNRQAEGREGHRPRMSDLRESGAIEQDADVILLLHREEYYKPQDAEAQGLAELIIAKQRNGPTDIVKLQFNKSLTKFNNLSFDSEPGGYEPNQNSPF